MNTHTQIELLAKAQHLCLLLLLCLCLPLGGVPGPCRYSVTRDHVLSLNRLIDNQLDHSCLIIYPFTDHHNLSQVCYIKAAFPQILELLRTHFHYVRNSDNRRYVSSWEKDSPVRFTRMIESSPKEALKRVRGVIQMYLSLMTKSGGPVDWDCQAEYAAEEEPESTAAADTSTTGEAGHC
ncbi:hypothetical protein INR49_031962 [Caranx melampygus]|nr:hypothetical protein INR49_031962 [Caranx melampygus]